MNRLLLLAALCSAPALARPHLLVPDDKAPDAEPSRLSARQLFREDYRLEDPPAIGGYITLISFGAPLLVAGTWLSYLAIDATSRSYGGLSLMLWSFIDFVTICVGIAGGAMGIAGGVMLGLTMAKRERLAERQRAVRAQLEAIRSGRAESPYDPFDEAELVAELARDRRERDRPGLGLPIGLMGGGLGASAWAVYAYARSAPGETPVGFIIGLACAGLALQGVGAVLLFTRLHQRAELDRQAREEEVPELFAPPPPPPPQAPPAPGAKLPRAPVWFSYAWRF